MDTVSKLNRPYVTGRPLHHNSAAAAVIVVVIIVILFILYYYYVLSSLSLLLLPPLLFAYRLVWRGKIGCTTRNRTASYARAAPSHRRLRTSSGNGDGSITHQRHKTAWHCPPIEIAFELPTRPDQVPWSTGEHIGQCSQMLVVVVIIVGHETDEYRFKYTSIPEHRYQNPPIVYYLFHRAHWLAVAVVCIRIATTGER